MSSKNWIKLVNHPIDDWNLFKKWCKQNSKCGRGRIKAREHNGTRYIKMTKDMESNFNDYWNKIWPLNSVVLSTNVFYKDEYLDKEKDQQSLYYGVGYWIWAERMKDLPDDVRKKWFVDTLGINYIHEVYVDEKNWAQPSPFDDEEEDSLINVVDQVFVFTFLSQSEAVMFKLKYG